MKCKNNMGERHTHKTTLQNSPAKFWHFLGLHFFLFFPKCFSMEIIWELTDFSKYLISIKYLVLFLIKEVLAKHFSSSAKHSVTPSLLLQEKRKRLWGLLAPIFSLQEAYMGYFIYIYCPIYIGQLQMEQGLPQQLQVMLPLLTPWQTPEHCQSQPGSCAAPQRGEHSSGTLDSLMKDLSTPFPCQHFIYIIVQAVLNYSTRVENIPCQTWSWYINPYISLEAKLPCCFTLMRHLAWTFNPHISLFSKLSKQQNLLVTDTVSYRLQIGKGWHVNEDLFQHFCHT